tara:strand:+ start:824 stop:1198 length:375 start_codon:yes stop_codon:yes gene_type:complete
MPTVYQNPLSTLADKLVTVTTVTAASADNVTNATTGTIYLLEVDNSHNEFNTIYLKIADANSATAGTTQPKMTLAIPAQRKQTFVFQNGHTYTAGVCVWATRHPVYTDKTKPDAAITVKFLVTA